MPTFDYRALDAEGKTHSGILDADSARHARQHLRQLNLVPIEVLNSEKHSIGSDGTQRRYRTRLNIRQLALLTQQLAVLLRSAVTLSHAIDGLAKHSRRSSPQSYRVLSVISSSIREGKSLADSLKQFPQTFDSLYCATIAAGEKSGHLDLVLDQLTEHTESQRAFRQQTIAAMIYPIILVVLSIAIVMGLVIYIVPDVIKVFVDSGQPLPTITRGLLATTRFIESSGLLVLLFILIAVIGVRLAMRHNRIKLKVHYLYLHLPLVKYFSRGINAQRYTQTLGILSESGVVLHEGMSIAQEVVTNTYLKQQLRRVAARVREGQSVSQALEDITYFPPLMVYMLASGEASGEFDTMLRKAAEQQLQETKSVIITVVNLFEPLLLVFMGGIVLTIVLAILVPILNMNQLIG